MFKTKFVYIFLLSLSLTACTTTYTRPGATTADFQHDYNDCLVKAGQAGFYGGNFGASIQRNNFIKQCLEGMGWEKAS